MALSPLQLILAGGKKIVNEGKEALNRIAPDVKQVGNSGVYQPTTSGTVKNTILDLPKSTLKTVTKTVPNFIKDTAQGSARGIANLGQGTINTVKAPFTGKAPTSTVTPRQGNVSKYLYGTDQPFNFTSETEALPDLVGIKKGTTASKIISPILGFGLTASDAFTGGAGSKVLKTLAKEATEDGVIKILKTEAKGLSDDIALSIAPKIAKSQDIKEIRAILDTAKTTKSDPLKTIENTAKKVAQEGKEALDKPTNDVLKQKLPTTVQRSQPLEDTSDILPSKLETGQKKEGSLAVGRQSTPTSLSNSESSYNQTYTSSRDYVKDLVNKKNKAASLESPGFKGKIKNIYKDIKAKVVDSASPIEDAIEIAKKNGLDVKPKSDISAQIDRSLRAPTLAGQFAEDNGLSKVIKEVDDLDNLDQYLIAKQASDVGENGIQTGRNLEKDQILIKEFAPKYEEAAKQVNEYSRKLLDYSVDSGLISKELADNLKIKYPNYVPLKRVFNELERKGNFTPGGKSVASLSSQSVVQKLKGSSREIESPIQSLLEKTNDAFVQGERNKAARILAEFKDEEALSGLIKELPKGETAPHTFSYMNNGVKVTFETTKEIADAAKNLNAQQLGILGKILSVPMRLFKLGTTGINLPFVATNIVRDNITAFVNSQKGLKTSILNPKVFLESLFAAVEHNDLYKEMVRAGAGGTSFDLTRNQSKSTIESIRSGRSFGSKVKYIAKNPSELLRAAEDIVGRSEELTRLQQFKGTIDALVKEGMSLQDATIEASKAARENTANFYRKGEYGTLLNATIPYFNASIQGSRAFIRALSRSPKETVAKTAITVLMPIAAATAWNTSDPQRKQAYSDIAEYEKENNIIIIPSNPTKNEDGTWNVIKIPLVPGFGSLAGLIRRPMEAAQNINPVSFGKLASDLVGSISPVKPELSSVISSFTPQIIKPTIEAYTNRNLFTGFPQVPKNLEGLAPELQVKENTSGTAENIANVLGTSPIKTESFIKGTLGGIGSQALNAIDKATGQRVGGQGLLENLTGRFSKAKGDALKYKPTESDAIVEDKKNQSRKDKMRVMPIYNQAQQLIWDGKKEEADALVKSLSDEDWEVYKKIKTAEKTRITNEGIERMYDTAIQAKKLKDEGRMDEANSLVKDLSDEEYEWYKRAKERLGY